ncbi:MAG: hypothetical protein ABI670_07840 [Chloroflexota bacterium]
MSSNPTDREVARLLNEGQSAARRGDRAMARTLLTQLVERDPHNEEAWMWLSGVVTDPNEQQICLENALVINPYNAQARRGLEFVVAKTGTPSRVPTPPEPDPVYTFPTDLELDRQAEPPPAAQASVPAWLDQVAPQPPPAPEFAAPEVPAAPESWAMPGPSPANPYVAAAPYEVSDGFMSSNGNGHSNGNGRNSGSLRNNDVAGTVPYTAPEPSAMDVPFSGGSAYDMPRTSGPLTSYMNSGEIGTHDGSNGNGRAREDGYSPDTVNGFASPRSEPAPATESYTFDEAAIDAAYAADLQAGFQPFEGKLGGGGEDMMSDLPPWLEHLTPSASAPSSGSDDSQFSPQNGSGYGPAAGMPMDSGASPFGAPMNMGGSDMNQLNPYSDMRLPSPHELPGDDGRAGSASSQPWYLQSSGNNAMSPSMPTGGISTFLDGSQLSNSGTGATGAAVLDDKRTARTVATIACPNCKEQVADTSLACPQCRYNFFVNCPSCHELVDTSDAVPGQVEPCPYCRATINKMDLGLTGVADLVSQKSPGSRPADATIAAAAFPSMQATPDIAGTAVAFNWLVDLLWLVVIVMMVWALTQLPSWLNLSGIY